MSKAAPARMHIEEARLASFAPSTRSKQPKWPHPPSYSVTPTSLARAGFHYAPVPSADDSASCFTCEKALGGWEDGDDALDEHLQHTKRSCPFARVCAIERARAANARWWEEEANAWMLDIHSPEALEARLRTFSAKAFTWPHDKKKGWRPTSTNLAAAGFTLHVFTHDEVDTAMCAYCGRTLSSWEKDDDPIEEHRRKHEQNPCPFFLFPPTLAVPPPVEEDDEIVIVEPVAKPNKRKKAAPTRKAPAPPSSTAATSDNDSVPAPKRKGGRTRSIAATTDEEDSQPPSLRASRRGAAPPPAEAGPSLRASRSASAAAASVITVESDNDAAAPVPPPKPARKPRGKKEKLEKVEEDVPFEVVVEVRSLAPGPPLSNGERPKVKAKPKRAVVAPVERADEEEAMVVDEAVVQPEQLASPPPTTIAAVSPPPPIQTETGLAGLLSPADMTELVGPHDMNALTAEERAMTVREWHEHLGRKVYDRVEAQMRADLRSFEDRAAKAREKISEVLDGGV